VEYGACAPLVYFIRYATQLYNFYMIATLFPLKEWFKAGRPLKQEAPAARSALCGFRTISKRSASDAHP
jgi:hypothetical protein